MGHLKVNCPAGAREATLGCPQRGRLGSTPFHKEPVDNIKTPVPKGTGAFHQIREILGPFPGPGVPISAPEAVGILALVGHGLQGGHHHGLVRGVGHAEPAVGRGEDTPPLFAAQGLLFRRTRLTRVLRRGSFYFANFYNRTAIIQSR